MREDGVHKFLFVGRLLRDKGILIFAEAAERIKEEFGDAVSFRAVGPFTPGNPNAITPEEVAHWQKRDIVDFVGPSDQIALYFLLFMVKVFLNPFLKLQLVAVLQSLRPCRDAEMQ